MTTNTATNGYHGHSLRPHLKPHAKSNIVKKNIPIPVNPVQLTGDEYQDSTFSLRSHSNISNNSNNSNLSNQSKLSNSTLTSNASLNSNEQQQTEEQQPSTAPPPTVNIQQQLPYQTQLQQSQSQSALHTHSHAKSNSHSNMNSKLSTRAHFKSNSANPFATESSGSHYTNSNNNNNKAERKVTYKFKSGEQFISYQYLTPQKIIGEGSYASVCSAMDTRTKKKYAIKKNRNAFVNIGDAKRILRELKLMYHFRDHPNLMSVVDVIPPDKGTEQSFNDVYLIMPKMHMTLSKLILKSSIGKIKLFEHDVQIMMYQICRGLEYMHSAGVIHRDLKPENILVNCYFHQCDDPECTIQGKALWQVRITDFGLARGINASTTSFQDENTAFNRKENPRAAAVSQNGGGDDLTEYVVTRYYRAPEVMCCSRFYNTQIDVWSLGCIMGEIYYKKPLFRGNNHLHQLQVIFFHCGTPYDLSWVKMQDARQWIAQLPKFEKKNYKQHFSFYNYCNSGSQSDSKTPWNVPNDERCGTMSDLAVDFLDKLLTLDPSKRWNISSVLRHPWLKRFYKQSDFDRCPPFDTSFEQQPILRTNFGVRHLMYTELVDIHNNCKQNLLAGNN